VEAGFGCVEQVPYRDEDGAADSDDGLFLPRRRAMRR